MKKSTVGLAPGTLLYEGESKKTRVRVLSYSDKEKFEQEVKDLQELPKLLKSKMIHWVQVCGLGDIQKIQQLGEFFNINTLVLEDVLNHYQRPKIESFDDYDFLTLRRYFLTKGKVNSDQISLLIAPQTIISFQHTEDDIFCDLEGRFAKRRYGRLSRHGSYYLAYALIDFIIDQYFFVQEHFEEKIAKLSEDIHRHQKSSQDVKDRLYTLRMNLLAFRRAILPLAEMADRLLKNPRYIEGKDNIVVYLQDLRDHILHTQDFARTYGETLEGLSSLYFSITADKTNQVMQVLTVITVILMPLTLLAGIYGMNFKYMPELESHWAYPTLIIVMFGIAITIYRFFKRKDWL
ncbi:magnesium/cobalt transporter CorA [Candidatus Gracilibacteria bacterium]|nr:magnesium/cobalt transporter CorA [Candidatus Gracilibacteria bacterium]